MKYEIIIVLCVLGFLGMAALLAWCCTPASRRAMAAYRAAEREAYLPAKRPGTGRTWR